MLLLFLWYAGTLWYISDSGTANKYLLCYTTFSPPFCTTLNSGCLSLTVAQLISSLRGSESLLPSEGWKNQTWNSSNVESTQSMKFSYKIECDASFFGDSCTTICTPRNDDLGHYECGPSGEKICRQGWEGDFCTKRKYYLCVNSVCSVVCLRRMMRRAGGGLFITYQSLPWLNKLAHVYKISDLSDRCFVIR